MIYKLIDDRRVVLSAAVVYNDVRLRVKNVSGTERSARN